MVYRAPGIERLKQRQNHLELHVGITQGVTEVSLRRIPGRVTCGPETQVSLHFTSTALMAQVQASLRPLREAVVFTSPGLGEDSSYPEGWPRWGWWNSRRLFQVTSWGEPWAACGSLSSPHQVATGLMGAGSPFGDHTALTPGF